MPIQAPQWTDFRLCPVCQNEFNPSQRPPISLGCGHSICQSCLLRLSKQQCPFDLTEIQTDITKLPVNNALLSLVCGVLPEAQTVDIEDVIFNKQQYDSARQAIEVLAQSLQNCTISGNINSNSNNNSSSINGGLTRPMQRKLISLVHCQLVEEDGRVRAVRAARSIGERAVKELILMHQSPQTLSAALWAAVRQRGCQFLGPAMQEAVLQLILLALEDGISLSRKVLVLFVVQKLEKQFTQASKTSIGHVVQLLYRASCFKVTKRDGDSSLLQLHEKYRTYSSLRKEHDAQIVQIAMEAGLHISPEQWSALLYGDDDHKSHMQSIIDKLQTPASFGSSIQELIIALQRTDDPHKLQDLRLHLERLAQIDPSTEAPPPTWQELDEAMQALKSVMNGLQDFAKEYAARNRGNIEGAQMINTKYRTSMCRDILNRNSCPRGANCNFAHNEDELERHRRRRHVPTNRMPPTVFNGSTQVYSSRSGSNSSPDSLCNNDFDEDILDGKLADSSLTDITNGLNTSGGFRPSVTTAPPVAPQQYHGQPQQQPQQPPQQQPMTEVLTENMKNLSLSGYYQGLHQPTSLKKENSANVIKMPPPFENSTPQQRSSQPASAFIPYNSPPQQPPSPYYEVPPQQQSMYVTQANQPPSYMGNGAVQPIYHHPQQISVPQHQLYQQYQQEYGYSGAPAAIFPLQASYNMRGIAVARSAGDRSSFFSKDEASPEQLSLKIPYSKEETKDDWKFNNNGKYSRTDSCLDSGRGSSLGYSSDTFSPLSNTSSGSRSSPPSAKEAASNGSNASSGKTWDTFLSGSSSDIWAPHTESSKLSTWSLGVSSPESSNNNPTTNNRSKEWDSFGAITANRIPENDHDTSTESAGKTAELLTPNGIDDRNGSYSRMKTWGRMTDTPHRMTETPHRMTDTPHRMTDTPHRMTDTPHRMTDTPHRMTETPHRMADTPHRMADTTQSSQNLLEIFHNDQAMKKVNPPPGFSLLQ